MAHSVVMNSLLEGEGSAGEQAVIEHSHLEGAWSIGRASFVSQIHSFTDLAVADAIAVQEVAVGAGSCVLICYGVHDAIKAQFDAAGATVCGQSWDQFFEVAGLPAKKVGLHVLCEADLAGGRGPLAVEREAVPGAACGRRGRR